ncbi:MAG: site-specific integrase [Selenomonadaceae bacterium]|nr:site-specific integrase [Selenomonadaceae bacterium]
MKRANGEGTISKRADGRWIGQITIGFDDNGKAIRKACSAKSQAECKRKLDKLKNQFAIIQGKPIVTTKKSFVDYLLNDWINEKRYVEKLEESTVQTHISRINCYFPDFFGDIELQKFDSRLIANFYAYLAKKNLSAETIHKIHAIINNSFKKAVRDGLVAINPTVGIKLPKVHQKEKSSLSDAEVKRILQAAKDYCNNPKTKNKNIFPLINLALVSGLRRGELLALTWDNIDFTTGKIYVTNSVCELKDKIIIKTTKTDASKRSMIIPYAMIELLREHGKNFATGRFVFPCSDDKDKPQAPSNICRVYRKILSLAGVKSSLHILRHTNITNLITSGVDIKTVKNRAGHTRIETTMSYTHPSEEFDRQAANIFEKFL